MKTLKYALFGFQILFFSICLSPLIQADPNNTFEIDDIRVSRNTSYTDYLFTNTGQNTTQSALATNPHWHNHGPMGSRQDVVNGVDTTAVFEIQKSVKPPYNEGSFIIYANTNHPAFKTATGSGDSGEIIVEFVKPLSEFKGNEMLFLEIGRFEMSGGDVARMAYGDFGGMGSTLVLMDEANNFSFVPLSVASLGSSFGLALSWTATGAVTAKYATTFSTFNLNDTSWTTLGTSTIYQSQTSNNVNYFAAVGVAFNPEPTTLALLAVLAGGVFLRRRKILFPAV